jgi:hypothetical protein
MILNSLFLAAIGFNTYLVFISILLVAAFLYFLHKADIFDGAPFINKLAFAVFGGLAIILRWPLWLILDKLDITVLGYGMWSDLIYCLVKVAFVDEFLKAIPFIILLLFTSKINEPFDFLKYICISALGYACIDNLMHCYEYDTVIITQRFFYTALTQVFYSALLTYVFMLNDYIYKRPQLIAALAAYGAAVLIHGIFQFLLVNEYFITTYGQHVVWTEAFVAFMLLGQMFNTAISNSGYYTLNRQKLLLRAAVIFVLSILGIFILSAGLVFLKHGNSASVIFVKDNVIYLVLLVLYTSSTFLAHKFVKRATWLPVWNIKKAPVERN